MNDGELWWTTQHGWNGSTSLWGRLNEVEFLGRLYDLRGLPSRDPQCADAREDIARHTVANDDYVGDWVFDDQRFGLTAGPDEYLLCFLAATVHPEVQSDEPWVTMTVQLYNEILRRDGYELVADGEISGRPVYEPRDVRPGAQTFEKLRIAAPVVDNAYLTAQIDRMNNAIESDPALAIGTAKELLETVCKTVLEQRAEPFSASIGLTELVRETRKVLRLQAEDAGTTGPAAEHVKRILGSLGQIVDGIGHLRNYYGTGHGQSAAQPARGLGPRHARLVVGSASTLAVFLFETHEARQRGES